MLLGGAVAAAEAASLSSETLTVAGGQTGFTLLAGAQTGVAFTNAIGEWTGASNRVLYNGAGVALGDYDGDGKVDIYLCRLEGANALYQNLGGWRFEERAVAAGVTCVGSRSRGAVFADINGDTRLDLLVATVGRGVLCFTNTDAGRFQEDSIAAGTFSQFGASALTLADVDGNSTLDLYVGNNRTDDIRDRGRVDLMLVNGKKAVPPALRNRLALTENGALLEYGEPDVLYLNKGPGRFTPQPWNRGTFLDERGQPLPGPPLDWALSAAFHDANGDGAPDLYVCNDYWTPDRIWMNDGQGRFRAASNFAFRSISASSMGVDFADLDGDGRDEILVLDMLSRDVRLRNRQVLAQKPMEQAPGALDSRLQIMRNTLFHNRGDGTFAEIANFAGVAASEWSWSPVFLDVDLDGYKDLLISSGHFKDVQDLDTQAVVRTRQRSVDGLTNAADRQKAFTQQLMENLRLYPDFRTPIVAFRNRGDLTFEDVTGRWGTGQPGVHHGLATADLDGDGDLDLVANNLNENAALYRNDGAQPRVAFRLRGKSFNTQAIGARLVLRGGATPEQSQEIECGGRYLSGGDTLAVFAASSRPMSLEVRWRSGVYSRFDSLAANRIYVIDETSAPVAAEQAATPARSSPSGSWFEDATPLLSHRHTEVAFDDFARQPLLPRRLSQQGPGLAWADLDGDGDEDLAIGSGKGGRIAVFLNEGNARFRAATNSVLGANLTRDADAMLIWPRPAAPLLLAGLSNYEDGQARGPAVRSFDLAQNTARDAIPAMETSVGPLALAELGKHQMVLFVGGGYLPAKYPQSGASRLFRSTGQQFELDAANSEVLRTVGNVTSAVWSDIAGDSAPELIVAGEWGPIRVFQFAEDRLREITEAVRLSAYRGLWSGLTTGDFDGDGRLDIVAGNWGLNSPWKASTAEPLILLYRALPGSPAVELLETTWQEHRLYPVRLADQLVNAFPFLAQNFTGYRALSEKPVQELLGSHLAEFSEARCTTLASTVFLNRNGQFEARPLPTAAQLAPVFGVNVADFDGDGREDIFLAQNFSATRAELPRLDAGRGLILKGDGAGGFEPVDGAISGIAIYGEQRGSAVADFDGDGRIDLAVGQNGAETKLYRNRAARPGLRIRLVGPAWNALGAGAVVRVGSKGQWGPAREIHLGSGYLSQDSPIQILPWDAAASVQVRWADGQITETPVPKAAREMVISYPARPSQ